MTTLEATEIVTTYAGSSLLESLERIQDQLNNGIQMRSAVRVAYYTLMAGFTELLATD